MAVVAEASPPATLVASDNVRALLSPALTQSLLSLAVIFPRLLSTTTLFVLLRAYFLSAIILRQSAYAAQLLAAQSYYACSLMARQLFAAAKQSLKLGWKATERLRKKLIFELAVFVLGTGGNSMILLVFWPGWIVIGGVLGVTMWACR
ncbi:hypothetical protein M430DRAFT_35411 [Amorphotheca resinae ATCC 22711]|jgi:hypothetical protein|uniref:Uncharacterized protein n=1 Tax=Amorphotheca resinae ATCC 22711 TaxID=857342 RepID=A0A2T3AZZ5_AMORE|nr:hypothetical protein M430DRAFT_35411 [Amorphotheca resinae ATCC 22711]PSS16728.1 hypothetical protein M430DRAFT_35411 [Amorphotheca resinae ATCC 22711]